MSFEQYATELYPRAQARTMAALVQNTPLAQFETVVLRLMLERAHIVVPETDIGETFRVLAAKACNEAVGFIGCLQSWGTVGATDWNRYASVIAKTDL